MAGEIAFAAPTTEEMTGTAVGIAGAGVAGVVEGVVALFAPRTGELAPFLSWGTLMGVPLVGAAGALFSRGIVGDLFRGVAAGGTAIIGYTIPAMLTPAEASSKKPAGQPGNQPNVKQLTSGPAGAPQTAQKAPVSSVLEF